MPTLDWLNRANAFATAARVPYRLLEQVSIHGPSIRTEPAAAQIKGATLPAAQAGTVQAELLTAPVEPLKDQPFSTPLAQTALHDNLLIQGDNLEALKALLPFYRGQVKCIFIDPPYNTRSAFEHYDDNLEHAQWLSMMLPRLQLLRELLREDGSIWVTIDDNEGHYLKVLMDEVFGRGNFVANVVWQKRFSPNSTAIHLSDSHDHVIVFAKTKASWGRNLLARTEKSDSIYKNLDNDPRGDWTSSDLSARNFYSLGTYPIVTPAGRLVSGPPPGRYWGVSEQTLNELRSDNRVWWGKTGDGQPRLKRFLHEVQEGVVPQTVWLNDDVGHTQEAKKEVVAFNPTDVFTTPKPERLIQRILHIATNPNDLILDSFLGSGTTAAVAHKMGRRWIGIEMGEHAATHCLPRLQKVIDGEQGGISKAVGWGVAADGGEWTGGGGFRFMRLGETVFDEVGRINPAVRFATLAAFIWQQETAEPWTGGGASPRPAGARPGTPYLGTHYVIDSYQRPIDEGLMPILSSNTTETGSEAGVSRPGFACYLLFNGILGDKRPASGNVLTLAVLDALLTLHAEIHGAVPAQVVPLLVYGEACRLGSERLKLANVRFRHIPYDVKAR